MPATLSAPCFAPARRINRSLTATLEARTLRWLAGRVPLWLTSDQLTLLGLLAQFAGGVCYALARHHRLTLWLACVCILFNWFGDSMDGTLARTRNQQRPRYGFYVDHLVDMLGAIALMAGLGSSGMLHWPVAAAMLVAFLLLSGESYLATYTLGRFELSQCLLGPSEIRLLLIAGTLALIRSPYATLFHHRMLLFDLGGVIASTSMFVLAVILGARHTAQLYREEPLP